MTLIALCRLDVAAAEDAFRQEDVEIALDIGRHGRADLRRIDRDSEADRDILGLQYFRKLQHTKPAHRMPDKDDQSGILAILANGASRDQAANRELVDIRRDARIFDLFRQMIHPAREDWTERAAEQVGTHVR